MTAIAACEQPQVEVTPALDLNKTAAAVTADGGAVEFEVTANVDWTADADQDWVSVDPQTGNGNAKVKATVAANETADARTAKVTVKADKLTKTLTITQEGKKADEPVVPPTPDVTWGMMGCFVDNLWSSDVPMTQEGEWIVAKGAQFTELTFKIRGNASWDDATNIGVAPGADRGVVNGKVAVVTAEYAKANLGGDAADIRINGEAGTYDVYFSFENLEVYVMEEGYKPGEKEPQNPDPVEITYTVVGTLNNINWNNAAPEGLMTAEGDYYVARNVPFVTAATLYGGADQIEFKIVETGTWTGYGRVEEAVNPVNTEIALQMGGDNIMVTGAEGPYDVYFDKANLKVWVMTPGTTPGAAPETPEQPEPAKSDWHIVGSFTGSGWGWDAAAGIALDILDANYFGLLGFELPEGAQFKFLQGTAWGGAEVGAVASVVEPNTIQAKGTNNIMGIPAGKYDIYLAADASAFYIMSEGKTPAEATEPAPVEVTYTVTGTIKDANWNNAAPVGLMVEEGGVYVAKNVEFQWESTCYGGADQIALKIFETGTWTGYGVEDASVVYELGSEIPVVYNAQGNIAVAAPEGVYDVYFDKTNEKVWVVAVGQPETPEANALNVQWLFTADAMTAYADNFGTTAGVADKAAGDGGMYVQANAAGEGKISYVQVDKTELDVDGKATRITGGTGHPYVTGIWPGDYWLFEATDGTEYAAGTAVNISYITRTSKTGHKYWRLEYLDGAEWKPAMETTSYTLNEQEFTYNIAMNNDGKTNVEVNATVTLSVATKDVKFRMLCVANGQSSNEAYIAAPNGGTCRIAGDEATSPVIKVVK